MGSELLERNRYPSRDEKQEALEEIHMLPGLANYTHLQLRRWLCHRRSRHEPVEPRLPPPIVPAGKLFLRYIF